MNYAIPKCSRFFCLTAILILAAVWMIPPVWSAPVEKGDKPSGSTERNPFAYPPRVVKEMAQTKAGDGKTPGGAPVPPKVYALTGILWTDKGGVASINRRILREGETVDEYRVFRVEKNRVILKKDGEELVLSLFQSPVIVTEPQEKRSTKKKKF